MWIGGTGSFIGFACAQRINLSAVCNTTIPMSGSVAFRPKAALPFFGISCVQAGIGGSWRSGYEKRLENGHGGDTKCDISLGGVYGLDELGQLLNVRVGRSHFMTVSPKSL